MAAKNETIIAQAIAAGATSTQYNTALKQMAVAAGATAEDLPGALMETFAILGYTGTLSERMKQWENAGYPAPAAYDHDWSIVDLTTNGTGYREASVPPGDFEPQTNPFDANPITVFRVDASNYLYVGASGSHGGTTLYVVIEGFNTTANAIAALGDVGQWYAPNVTGLKAFADAAIGTTIGVNLYDADPA